MPQSQPIVTLRADDSENSFRLQEQIESQGIRVTYIPSSSDEPELEIPGTMSRIVGEQAILERINKIS